MQPSNANSVVGTWKEVASNGSYIYQFYADGTGIFHLYDEVSGVLSRSDYFTYNSNTRTIEFNYTFHGERYVIERGKLYFYNHIGQIVGTLDRI